MLLNIITAISNLTVLYPLYSSFVHADYLTFIPIIFVGSASFISHLFENHKHGMPGIANVSVNISYFLNRLDVAGVAITISRLLYIYYQKHGTDISTILGNKTLCISLVCSFLLNIISEYDKYNSSLRSTYVITHSLWHISIYIIMGLFMKTFIYIN